MQSLLDNEEISKKKNRFLQPIYRDLKTTIKHMTFTHEYKLMREYVRNRQMILDALPAESKKGKIGLKKLQKSYSQLILNHKTRMQNDDSYKLKEMSSKLEGIYKLFDQWQSYIDVIYAPEIEINMMETLKKEGLLSMDKSYDNESFGIDEFSFSKRMQNEDINDKLQALFAKNEDDDLEEDVETIKSKIDDAYKTANEEITTDTPLTSEAEGAQEMRAS